MKYVVPELEIIFNFTKYDTIVSLSSLGYLNKDKNICGICLKSMQLSEHGD